MARQPKRSNSHVSLVESLAKWDGRKSPKKLLAIYRELAASSILLWSAVRPKAGFLISFSGASADTMFEHICKTQWGLEWKDKGPNQPKRKPRPTPNH